MAKEDYTISDIYQGGYNTLAPPSNSYATAGSFGITTDPRSANILKEVSSKLSMGVKQIEIAAVDPSVFDSIPKQQLKEVNRLSKLTGIDVTMHGPVTGMHMSGIGQQGFNEVDREDVERRVVDVLLRSHDLNPEGNIPVNFHSSEGIPASQLLPPSQREEGKDYKRMIAINRDSGKLMPLEEEKLFHPGGKIREVIKTPEKRLKMLNDTEWDNSLFQVEVNRENAERIMKDIHPITTSRFSAYGLGKLNPKDVPDNEMAEFKKIASANKFVEQAQLSANSLFSRAYELAEKDGDKGKMDGLKKLSEEYGKLVGIEGNKVDGEKYHNPMVHSEALRELTGALGAITPKAWVPLEKFATKKTAETFGNAAFKAYQKFKDTTPILVIENPPATQALSTGEDIANIVKQSREQFVKKAVEEGISENQAKKQAEKLIGATWDVGHINMLRKYGYDEKDIIKESEKVAPYIKHVHLSDNFGFEHTELPMGMGNVPLKEIMEKLGKKGFEAKKIIEAGHWWQHFQTPPFQEVLESTNTPLYSMKMSPNWSQAPELYQGYFSGYGQMLPQINYETFGAGFSRLPAELGGSAQGAGGNRMSGRPME